jgi:uncharacterized protein YukE
MSQIRVDPGELAQAAQKFGDLAARLSQLAAETVQAAESAPSYEGQFAPQVQSMGQDAQSRLSQQATRLRTLGEELAATASAFESADQQSLQGFEQLMLQFRGLLDGLGQLLPGGLGATIAAGQPFLGLQPVPPPPEPPKEEEDEKSLLERFADQIDLEFFWDLITQNRATTWMRRFRTAIPVTLVLPMLKGFGMDDVAGPLVRTFDGSFWVRTAGRVLGDASAPPLFVVGWGLSALPEQIENIRTGAPWNEFVADMVIDSGIYLGSEGAGWVGLVGGTAVAGPEAGVPLKFGADIIAGAYLEYQAETHGWREGLAAEVRGIPVSFDLWMASALEDALTADIPPIPTPPEVHSAIQTPVPYGAIPRLPLPTETPSPPMTAPPLSPIPSSAPPPGESH